MEGIDLSGVETFVQSLMVDTCRIFQAEDTMEGAWNDDIGTYDPPSPRYKYDGKCQLWSSKQGARNAPEGEADSSEFVYFIEIPRNSCELHVDDRIEITAMNEFGDQQLLGSIMRIESIDLYTYSVSTIAKAVIVERDQP